MFTTFVFCQELKINNKFIIEFKEGSNSEMEFSIISVQPFDKVLESSKMQDVFTSKTKKNQIQGVFAKGKFGRNVGTMLILKSGYEEAISYELQIKYSNKRRFRKTSTSAIFNNVNSIEYWPDEIKEIKFVHFKKMEFRDNPLDSFEIKIDSTCFSKPEFDIDYSDKILEQQISILYDEFSDDNGFKIENVIKYEKTINSIDESPGNFNAFTENEGYIKKKKLAKPLSFNIVECPYLKRETLYFYNKKTKNIKLVLFDWDKYEFSNFPPKTNYEKSEIEEVLISKQKLIIEKVSQIFGAPINKEPIKVSGRLETEWIAENGIKAKTYLFMNRGIYNIRLYIYK